MKSNKLPVIFNKTKRTFLLIEIIIAFAIISLFTIPLIRNPIYFCISQLNSLKKIECERIADLTFLDLKLSILKKEINVHDTSKYEKDAKKIPINSYFLKDFKNNEITRSYKIYCKRKKQAINDQVFKLVYIKIYLQPKESKKIYKYKYKMNVEL